MSNLNEWELLVAADDIEPGDTLNVEGDDDETMVFVSYGKGVVQLKDKTRKIRKFHGSSLEEVDGSAYITGKSEDELDLTED